MKRGHWQILLAAALFLLALGLTLYPVVSNWYIGRHQSRIQTEYREVLEQTDSAEIESIRESAVAYNKTITPGAAEEAYSQASIRLAAEDYVNQVNVSGSGIMGYVEIPKIGVDLPIYHGTGADSLDRGTGHLLGSSLPVGGESTHTIITGHSGMASQKMFTDLEQLREGDIFYLHVLDETLTYEVRKIHTVLPHDTTYLGIEPGEDLCTLVTCTPTGVNTHRLLVRGHRVNTRESQKHVRVTADATRIDPIITAPVIALPMLAVLLIWLLVTTRKRPKAGKHEKTTRGDPHETNS